MVTLVWKVGLRTRNSHWKPNMSQGVCSQVSICDFIYTSESPSKEVISPVLPLRTLRDSEKVPDFSKDMQFPAVSGRFPTHSY